MEAMPTQSALLRSEHRKHHRNPSLSVDSMQFSGILYTSHSRGQRPSLFTHPFDPISNRWPIKPGGTLVQSCSLHALGFEPLIHDPNWILNFGGLLVLHDYRITHI